MKILWRQVMGQVKNLCLRIDRKNPAFHGTDVAIPGAEISGQGDDA